MTLTFSNSLAWEYESPSPFVGGKLLRYRWWRGLLSLCIRHLPLTNFLSYVLTAHCSRAFVSLSLSRTAPLIWNIILHFSPLQQCTSTRQYHITRSQRNLVLVLFQAHFLQLWLKGAIMHAAFIEQDLNLKLYLSLTSSDSSLDTSSALIKDRKGDESMGRKWKWIK